MPIVGFRIRVAGAVPGVTLTDPALNDMLREAWYAPGKFWHVELRPKHFTREGGREYGYLPRAGEGETGKGFWKSYTGRKQKKFGHTLPLVFSGDLRDRARTARIDNKPGGVKVVLPGANKANFHNPHSKIDMREELTRVSDQEAGQLAGVLEESLTRRLDRFDVAVTLPGEGGSTSVAGFYHGE